MRYRDLVNLKIILRDRLEGYPIAGWRFRFAAQAFDREHNLKGGGLQRESLGIFEEAIYQINAGILADPELLEEAQDRIGAAELLAWRRAVVHRANLASHFYL